MQFIIEDNIDFFKELNSTNEIVDCSRCLITNMPLEDNFITLTCNHQFNYIPLFEEIRNQKKINSLETRRLSHKQMKCPYCRTITNNIMPFFTQYKLPAIYGVNSPDRFSLILYDCEHKFKSGKMKNSSCNKSACKSVFGVYCNTHYKSMTIKDSNKTKKVLKNTLKTKSLMQKTTILVHNNPIIDLSEAGIELVENKVIETFYNADNDTLKSMTVVILKKILRVNECKVSGRKQELIDRILLYKLKKGNLWIKHE
jgi:hypothetical protein